MILAILLLVLIFTVAGFTLLVKRTETGKKLLNMALRVYIESRGNLRLARRIVRRETSAMSQAGAITVETIIIVFVAILIIYQLIPTISGQNSVVQGSSNVSAMGKFAAGLGEWLFPLFGVLALVFLLWKRGSKGKGI